MKKIGEAIINDNSVDDVNFIDDFQFKAELAQMDLGDNRRNERMAFFITSKLNNPTGSIPDIFKSTNSEVQAAYRILDNDQVNPEAILKAHFKSTLKRVAQFPVMLMIDDLSYFDYSNKEVASELGMIGNRNAYGLVTSPLLAVTPERNCMGLADWETWCRDPNLEPSLKRYYKQPIEEKESYHWLKRYRKISDWQGINPKTQLIYVADRGGDILDIYKEAEERKNRQESFASYVIRCAYDRLIIPDDTTDEGKTINKIQQKLSTAESLGEIEFDIQAAHNRSARTVKMIITIAEVTITTSAKKKQPAVADLTVVRMREEGTTPENEKPLEWTLMTNIEVSTYEDALRIVDYYLCRWQVELYFKVLKSGCGVEKLYLQTKERLENCLAIYALVAWRLLYLTQVARNTPDLPCTVVFTDSEWKATYRIMNKKKELPSKPITLIEMMQLVGALGGFMPRKDCMFPGIKSIWKGMQKVYNYTEAYELFILGK